MSKQAIFVCSNKSGKKDLEVEAQIFGPLALHRNLDGRGWNVTHIASGGSVAWARSYKMAKKLAVDLSALDWSRVKSHTSVKALAAIRPLRAEILRRHGVEA